MNYIRKHPIIVTAVIIVVALLWLRGGNIFEGFFTCFTNKSIILQDMTGGLSEGVVELEKNRGRLYISVNANLPYHKAGDFGESTSNYGVYLVDRKNDMRIFAGYLIRYGDRRYRLKNELLGNYDDYTHVIVVRHQINGEGFPDVVVLEGALV